MELTELDVMPKGNIELHTDLLLAWEALNDAEWGRLVKAMLVYRLSGETVRLCGNERSLFSGEKLKIDRKAEAEERRREKTKDRVTRYRALHSVTERYPPPPSSPPAPSPSPPTPPSSSSLTPVPTPTPKEKPPKGGKKKAPTPPEKPGFGPELSAAFSEWLQYKREKRQDYKPTGLRTLSAKVQKYAEAYGEHTVAELIRDCMSSNYQGILWDRLGKSSGRAVVPTPGDNGWMKDYIRDRKEDGS